MTLKLYLLGQFKLLANDQPIELPSRPAQSLLAYLALNSGVTLRRELLADLIWPETSESNARSYLRQALWRIRKSLEHGALNPEEYLQISKISVTFIAQSDYWLDAGELLGTAETRPQDEIIEIVGLYRGELLPGFYEEWIVLERERLQAAYHQKMTLLLKRLTQDEQWENAMEWSERWIRLGHSPEPAFRALMRAQAGLGDKGMVSATYQRCVEALKRELTLEPSHKTQQLYEQILNTRMDGFDYSPSISTQPTDLQPSFLDEEAAQPIEKPVFVARERELAQLDEFLDLALAGQGRVVFITGDAGSGKTTLFQEFTRRAQKAHTQLVVASGNCNAYTGIGDPYLPLREIMELLTGDVEAKWAAGALTREHTLRLWHTLPLAVQALVETGPDLIDTFVPRTALLERVRTYSPERRNWQSRLDELMKRKPTSHGMSSLQQSDLFEQFTRVLQALARQVPMVLGVDDLQWADLGSISLLFHIGRQLAGSRILIVGAYRPEEVALGRDGGRHPLETIVNEFQRDFGDITVNVGQAESRDFIEAFLDYEPNRLGGAFRERLNQQTRGHPLFTIELLRGLQERGDLVRDSQGRWIEGTALDWERLPARVEAVIAERIGRLSKSLQDALRVASVEGEVFTAEVIAQVQKFDEREMLGLLSGELDRRHRLVRAQAIERLGKRRVSRYRFRNDLFQKYLYDNLDEVERTYLHEDVGNLLEELYGERANEIAVQLAWHFQEAGVSDKAIDYLHRAGERAVQLSAYQEAIAHLNRALTILMTLPDTQERAQQELALQITLGIAWKWGIPDPEGEIALTRARELCQQMGKTNELCQVLGEMSIFPYVRAEYQKACALGEEALNLAHQSNDPLLVALGNWHMGYVFFGLGEYTKAQDHLKQVITFNNPEEHHHSFVFLRGSDPGVSALAYDACCLWCLGYPDQALKRSHEALVLARELDHGFTLADVLCFSGCVFNKMYPDAEALKENAKNLARLSKDLYFPSFLGTGTCYYGDALTKLGQVEEGIEHIRAGLADRQMTGARCYHSGIMSGLAEAQAKAGQLREAMATLDDVFIMVEKTDERYREADLYRLRGELSLMQGNENEAQSDFEKAIQIARQQQARSWELRATIRLARLWQKQGKTEEARQVLSEIYDWFSEGFISPDLLEAKLLLEEISCAGG